MLQRMLTNEQLTFSGKVFDVEPSLRVRLDLETLELHEIGVEVTGAVLAGGEVPPRYSIKFPAGQPQYKVRAALENKGYEVGQKLGSKDLGFYAAKRVKPSKGWED